jgi:prepilin-type processing-associated H-X9-DG protein
VRHSFRLASGAFILLAVGQTLLAADDRASLARYVPANDLLVYAEFDGLDAHGPAWKRSAAYRMLNETTLGELTESLLAQGIDLARQSGMPVALPASNVILESFKTLARNGFVVAAHSKGPVDGRWVVVLRGGKSPEIARLLDPIFQTLNRGRPNAKPVTKAGRTITFIGTGEGPMASWDEGDDRILSSTKSVDSILAVLDGKEPSALKSPVVTELKQPEGKLHPIAVAFVEMSAFGPISPEAAQQGLDGIKRFDLRVGFDDEAMMTITRMIAPAPHKGALAVLDQPGFTLKSLPPLPGGLSGFTVASLDPGKFHDVIAGFAKADGPQAAKRFEDAEAELSKRIGMDFRRELLPHIGPKIAFYTRPIKPGAEGVSSALLDARLIIQIDNQAAVAKALSPAIEAFNASLNRPGQRPAGQPEPGFHKADRPGVVYTLTLPPETQLPGPLASLELTLAVGKDRLAVATSRKAAESALAVGTDGEGLWSPSGEYDTLIKSLPSEMVVLNINDPRETFPQLVAGLPFLLEAMNQAIAQTNQGRPRQPGQPPQRIPLEIDPAKVPLAEDLAKRMFPGSFAISSGPEGLRLVTRDAFPNLASPGAMGVGVALLLPAVQAGREAARRAQCINHEKQMALAMHNYHSTNDTFPRPAITDKDGKPLLSWRVALLPYLEQQALYNKFKLDEPWDSPHNKPLLDEMPEVYSCPSAPADSPTGSRYRVFVGNGALFEDKQPTGIRHVTDGTSNTIMIVETRDTVPWTKPDDLAYDPKKPAPFGAGSFHPGGYNATFADGSVRFLRTTINLETLKALITRSGGEVIAADGF